MLTAALFTMAKTWKQHKYPLKDEWIKMCLCICMYIYTYIYVYIYTCIYIHRHTHIYTQWNTTQPQKRMKYHLQQHAQT